MVENSKNLFIETYFIGKVSNTIIEDAKFEKMVQGIASNCTRMIIPKKHDNLRYAGQAWNLDSLLERNIGLQGQTSNYYTEEARGSCSVRYTDYEPVNYIINENEDISENTEHLDDVEHIFMIIDEPNWIEKLDKNLFGEHIATLAESYLEDAITNKDFFENIIDGDKYLGESISEYDVCKNISYSKIKHWLTKDFIETI